MSSPEQRTIRILRGGMWRRAVLLLAWAAVARAAAEDNPSRRDIRPSIECSCSSEDGTQLPFGLNCKRVQQPQAGSNQQTFSCEQDPSVQVQVGEEYTAVPGVGTFKLHLPPSEWRAAVSVCAGEGGRLAPLQGGAPHVLALMRALRAQPNLQTDPPGRGQVWVGLSDVEQEGRFVSVTGEAMSSDLTWKSGEPNNRGKDENCVSLGRDGLLRDTPCAQKLPFFCER